MSKKEYSGNELAAMLYGKRKKKKRIKKVEKVKKPLHWKKDFDSNELKLNQKTQNDD